MRHLLYVIHFTGRFEDMRRFYEWGLRLPVRRTEKDWIEFDTAGASIALHRMNAPSRQGTVLRFATPDLDATLAELEGRGVEVERDVGDGVEGRLASFTDTEGNVLQLLEATAPVPSGAGPGVEMLIVNVSDMIAATAFYRDRLGIPVLLQQNWWTELDTGATKLSLHPKVAATDELRHNAQSIVVGFDVPSLEDVGRELAERGLEFSGGPVDQRYGRFAEVTDPDDNAVLFRRSEPRAPLTPEHGDDEDEIARKFEEAPSKGAMRKPGRKNAKATSRVAVKPEYHAPKAATRSTNGTTPARVRPGTKRAKPGPASGRLHKAERRSAQRKTAATASASRGKPVKRGAAKRTGRSR